jgi:trehalose 6-phosphate phosphatase
VLQTGPGTVFAEIHNFDATAILLDIDGTLLDIAVLPSAVEVPARLKRALANLRDRTGGALAFVSGRPLHDIDGLFDPLKLAAIAGHGAEMRVSGAELPRRFDVRLSTDLRKQFEAIASQLTGVVLEDKGYSIALHYRLVPQHAEVLREAVAAACAQYPASAIEVLPGKAMIEIKPAAFSKGTGVRELMQHPPFRGRRPLFVGDDVTDETVFTILPELRGVGYSVGRKISGLAGCFPQPADVRDWLYRLAESTVAAQP